MAIHKTYSMFTHFPVLLMLLCGSWIPRKAFGITISSPIVGTIITAAFTFTCLNRGTTHHQQAVTVYASYGIYHASTLTSC